MQRRASVLSVLVLGALAFVLTGCVAPAADADPPAPTVTAQSAREACNAVGEHLNEASESFLAALQNLAADPTSVVAALETIADSFRSSAEDLDNLEVKAAVGELADAYEAFVDVYDAALSDPAKADPTDLEDAAQVVLEQSQSIAGLCQSS